MQHTHATPPTEGMVIHWANRYDVVVQLMTLGMARRFRRASADLLRVKPEDAILDVGCGTGDLALVLARRIGPQGSVVGVDAAPEMIARAQHKAQRRHALATFQMATAEALPFAAQQFHQVVTSLVMHHLPGDLKRQALAEMARVLKPGGQLTIVDFMSHSGRPQGHGGVTVEEDFTHRWLAELGFQQVTSGVIAISPFGKIPGLPPIGFIQTRISGTDEPDAAHS